MNIKTAVLLSALLLPLMLGALACDDNSRAPCLSAGGASTDTARGVAFSSAAFESCVQNAANSVVSSTGTAPGGSIPGGTNPSGTAPVHHRGQNN